MFLLEPKETQEDVNVGRKKVCLLSTLCVTSTEICVNASKEQGMLISNVYNRRTYKKSVAQKPKLAASGCLRIVINLYEMKCLIEENCIDSSLSTWTCKEVSATACNGDICRWKYANLFTILWLSEACIVSSRRNRLCNALLVSLPLANAVLSASIMKYFCK